MELGASVQLHPSVLQTAARPKPSAYNVRIEIDDNGAYTPWPGVGSRHVGWTTAL